MPTVYVLCGEGGDMGAGAADSMELSCGRGPRGLRGAMAATGPNTEAASKAPAAGWVSRAVCSSQI